MNEDHAITRLPANGRVDMNTKRASNNIAPSTICRPPDLRFSTMDEYQSGKISNHSFNRMSVPVLKALPRTQPTSPYRTPLTLHDSAILLAI